MLVVVFKPQKQKLSRSNRGLFLDCSKCESALSFLQRERMHGVCCTVFPSLLSSNACCAVEYAGAEVQELFHSKLLTMSQCLPSQTTTVVAVPILRLGADLCWCVTYKTQYPGQAVFTAPIGLGPGTGMRGIHTKYRTPHSTLCCNQSWQVLY